MSTLCKKSLIFWEGQAKSCPEARAASSGSCAINPPPSLFKEGGGIQFSCKCQGQNLKNVKVKS